MSAASPSRLDHVDDGKAHDNRLDAGRHADANDRTAP
jgi:hypothetical protein